MIDFPFFSGDGQRKEEPVKLPRSERVQFLAPEFYKADKGLVDAVNVALLLGQPLLLTGEPGTGKTSLAYYLAWELNLELNRFADGTKDKEREPILKFETKSDSTAASLFYTYDALKRFQHAQSGVKNEDALPYITYNALGKAILFSHEREKVDAFLPEGFHHPGRRRSVVLIDEIDKAPRDFPNDILNEIDQLYFRIPELENKRIKADPDLRPIIILTSNSEKDLPPAFLRRCIFYNILFPEPDNLKEIVANRLGMYFDSSNDPFLERAINLFYELRQPKNGLIKKPATAELLDLVVAMKKQNSEKPFGDEETLSWASTIFKTADDQKNGKKLIVQWLKKNPAPANGKKESR